MLLLSLAWVLSKEAAQPLLVGSAAVALLIVLVRQPVLVVYVLIAAGPFYDITRGFFFPGVELLGFWQDALVAILGLAAARSVFRHGLPKPILLDGFVVGFVVVYALSVLVSADTRVWFYGFRWFVLYPLMYLALRAVRFTETQQRRMLLLMASSLILSAILGLIGMWYLGWDAAADLYTSMNMYIFTRNDQWRWAATFSNPIIASSAFALFLLVSGGFLYFTKRRLAGLAGCAFGVLCIYLTHSRTGVVVAVCGVLAMLFAVKSRYAKPLLTLALTSSIVLAVQVVRNFDEWDSLRLQQFSRTLSEAVTDYPLGTGAGTAGAVSIAAASFAGQDPNSIDTVVGDSVILTVLRDTGWLGVACYLSVCIAVILMAWRARHTLVGIVSLAFWVGSLVNLMNSTDVYPTKMYLWLLAALAVANSGRVEPGKSGAGRARICA
jgi:hypothetical protein